MGGLRALDGDFRQACVVLLLLSDWAPGGGGTCFARGSHRWVRARLAAGGGGGGSDDDADTDRRRPPGGAVVAPAAAPPAAVVAAVAADAAGAEACSSRSAADRAGGAEAVGGEAGGLAHSALNRWAIGEVARRRAAGALAFDYELDENEPAPGEAPRSTDERRGASADDRAAAAPAEAASAPRGGRGGGGRVAVGPDAGDAAGDADDADGARGRGAERRAVDRVEQATGRAGDVVPMHLRCRGGGYSSWFRADASDATTRRRHSLAGRADAPVVRALGHDEPWRRAAAHGERNGAGRSRRWRGVSGLPRGNPTRAHRGAPRWRTMRRSSRRTRTSGCEARSSSARSASRCLNRRRRER